MFGFLNSSQLYGLQQTETATINNNSSSSSLSSSSSTTNTTNTISNSRNNNNIAKSTRQLSKLPRNGGGSGSGGGGGGGGGGGLAGGGGGGVTGSLVQHIQGMKVPANFIEKLIKSELLTGYEAVKHFKNFHHSTRHHHQPLHHTGSNLRGIDCDNLHGNYRIGNFADEDINSQHNMTVIKCPNDMQHQHQHQLQHQHQHEHQQTSGAEMEVIDSTTTTTTTNTGSSSILRNVDGNLLQQEDSPNGNSNEMISDNSSTSKSNDPSSSSSVDSPETERKTSSSTTASNVDRAQRRKLMHMITFLDQQNQRLQKELAKEKRRRAEELSRIIKSLICMESKLKIDKKQINQRLLEKDTEICRLVSLNRALRKKTNHDEVNYVTMTTTTPAEVDCMVPEALQCTSCKQEFYAIETKENWTQTSKDGRKSKDDPTTEHGSSSDETVSSSFYGARRSVRYTSKRTFGTFRDYMRSRSMNIDDPNLDNSEENASTISRDDSHNSYEKMNIYSRAIDRLHGVRRVSSTEGDLDSEFDNSSSRKNQSHSSGIEEDDLFSPAEDDRIFSPKGDKTELSPCSSKNNSLSRSNDFSEVSPKQEFETSTDDWYASASDGEEEAEGVRTKSYGYNVGVNPVLECVNQILLQQSMEESMNDSQPNSLEGNDNQILCSSQRGGRQSRSSSNGSTKDPGNTGTISRKRVHFSTKNSMVHVPRDDDDHDHDHIMHSISSPSASVIADQIKDNILNYESIYSNEYEPIGSENNSSNLYVDMETKLSPEERKNLENKPQKQPPALPPKPANLIKFKKALKVSVPQLDFNECDEQIQIIADDNKSVMSEPDYCSISEVNMVITNVQVIADVHKEPDMISSSEIESLKNDTQLMKTDEIEEIFADIPKLPNVAAIIAPKTPPANKINYTGSPLRDGENASKLQRSPRQFKRKHVPNILAEINKRINNSNPTTPTKIPNGILTMPTPSKKVPTPIIKLQPTSGPIVEEKQLPLQAEFDWYNLDVEYGKSSSPNQPDIIRASDVNIIEENGDELVGLHGVEYNLDEEFSLAGGNQPDIIKENCNDSPKTVNGISTPKTVCDDFPLITEVTPCLKKIKKTPNFDKFIDSSGLSTKPLPRQRKIYFAGPFV